MVLCFLECVEILAMVMLSVAFFSLFERKVMGFSQARKGPLKVSGGGILQPIADAMKLISKNEFSPYDVVKGFYLISPSITFVISSFFWILFPVWWNFISFQYSMVVLLILFSVSVYGIIFTGWFSSSKYALIGCIRALAQSISYEVGLTLGVVMLMLIFSTLSLMKVMEVNGFLFFPLFFISIIMMMILIAETNRSPYDLAEGESELVSGFCVEYGGIGYTLIFLSENLSVMFTSVLMSVIFFNGSMIATLMVIFLFVFIRSSLPRLRFDKVMKLFWLEVLPIQMGLVMIFLLMI